MILESFDGWRSLIWWAIIWHNHTLTGGAVWGVSSLLWWKLLITNHSHPLRGRHRVCPIALNNTVCVLMLLLRNIPQLISSPPLSGVIQSDASCLHSFQMLMSHLCQIAGKAFDSWKPNPSQARAVFLLLLFSHQRCQIECIPLLPHLTAFKVHTFQCRKSQRRSCPAKRCWTCPHQRGRHCVRTVRPRTGRRKFLWFWSCDVKTTE